MPDRWQPARDQTGEILDYERVPERPVPTDQELESAIVEQLARALAEEQKER